MTNETRIELGGADRVNEVRDLWLALHEHHRQVATMQPLIDDDEVSWERRRALYLDRLDHDAAFLALALRGDDVVGYALVCIEAGPDDTFPVGAKYAEVYSLSVAERMRGQGIGTKLLDFVDRELASRGIDDLKIAVMVGNSDAQRLYELRGLQPAELVLYRLGVDSRR
jgi:ribosomal protein S18 acetylase RimI-like enzyme